METVSFVWLRLRSAKEYFRRNDENHENLTTYNPGEIEGKWYSYWKIKGYFHEEVDLANKEPVGIALTLS